MISRLLYAAVLLPCCCGLVQAGGPQLQLSEHLQIAPQAIAVSAAPARGLHLKFADRAEASLVNDVVLRTALAMLGTDYEFGSNDADAVDCSALVQQAFRSVGMQLPRTVRELLRSGVKVKRSQLRAGDLMIYRWTPRQLHVAVYLDDGLIVHASPSAGEVVVTALDGNWRRRLVAVRRLL